MKYVELNLFPEEEEETQKSSDSKWNKKYNSDKGKEYNSDKGNEYSSDESNKYDFTNLFERLFKVCIPQPIPPLTKGQGIHSRERFSHNPQTCRGFRGQASRSCRNPQRRQADSNEGTSCIYCTTCHRLLLPRLLLQMASYTRRKTADKGRTAICCCCTYGLD